MNRFFREISEERSEIFEINKCVGVCGGVMAWKYNTCEIKIVQSCVALIFKTTYSIDRLMGLYLTYILITLSLLHDTTYFNTFIFKLTFTLLNSFDV